MNRDPKSLKGPLASGVNNRLFLVKLLIICQLVDNLVSNLKYFQGSLHVTIKIQSIKSLVQEFVRWFPF